MAAWLVAVLVAGQAVAQPAAPALIWEAPASCPTAADVEARIAARLEGPARPVRVRVLEVPDGVRVELSTAGADRTFVAPTCEEAATAVAVIVALAAHMAEPEPPAAPPLPPTPAPPAPEILVEPARAAPPGALRRWRWSASLAAALDAASLPRATPGLALGVHLGRGLFGLGLTTSAFLPQTEHGTGTPAVQTTVALVDVLVAGCVLAPLGRGLEAGGCLGGGFGVLHGRSASVTTPDANLGVRPEGLLLGRVEVPLFTHLRLHLEAGALADPIRSPFRVAGIGDVYRPPPVAFRGALGLDVRFR